MDATSNSGLWQNAAPHTSTANRTLPVIIRCYTKGYRKKIQPPAMELGCRYEPSQLSRPGPVHARSHAVRAAGAAARGTRREHDSRSATRHCSEPSRLPPQIEEGSDLSRFGRGSAGQLHDSRYRRPGPAVPRDTSAEALYVGRDRLPGG